MIVIQIMKELENKLAEIVGGNVLDVASGSGEFIQLIKAFKSFEKITAIELEEKFGDLIKKRFPDDNLEFRIMDASKPEFPDEHFDTVCISNSLHHLKELDKVLSEMKRVLKPNGQFIINEMFSDFQNESQMSHVKLHHWFAGIDELQGNTHHKTYRKEEIKSIIKELNFSDLDIIEYRFPMENPKDEKILAQMDKVINSGIKKLEKIKGNTDLISKAENIRTYIEQNGFASASSLFVVGKK